MWLASPTTVEFEYAGPPKSRRILPICIIICSLPYWPSSTAAWAADTEAATYLTRRRQTGSWQREMATTPAAATTIASRLFYPFRALGAVTDGLPFVLNRRGDECFLAVSIDRAFQVLPQTDCCTAVSDGRRERDGKQCGVRELIPLTTQPTIDRPDNSQLVRLGASPLDHTAVTACGCSIIPVETTAGQQPECLRLSIGLHPKQQHQAPEP